MMYTVIGRTQCEFCTKAEHLLRDNRLAFTSYHVDSPSSRWLLTLIVKAGYKTVPQIFGPDGKYIGGYTELKELLETTPSSTG